MNLFHIRFPNEFWGINWKQESHLLFSPHTLTMQVVFCISSHIFLRWTDYSSRISSDYWIWRHRLGHDCSSCDNTALSDGYSGHDLAITPYITPILNLNSSKNIEVRNKQANSIPPPMGMKVNIFSYLTITTDSYKIRLPTPIFRCNKSIRSNLCLLYTSPSPRDCS